MCKWKGRRPDNAEVYHHRPAANFGIVPRLRMLPLYTCFRAPAGRKDPVAGIGIALASLPGGVGSNCNVAVVVRVHPSRTRADGKESVACVIFVGCGCVGSGGLLSPYRFGWPIPNHSARGSFQAPARDVRSSLVHGPLEPPKRQVPRPSGTGRVQEATGASIPF